MRTRTWIAVAVLGLAIILWAQPMQAGPAQPMPPMPAEQAPPRMPGFVGLDLSPDQHEKMDKFQMSFLKETMPLETDVRIKEMELGALWRADKLNAKAIVAKVKEIAEIRTRLEVARVNQRINAYNVLTPEQQKQRRMFARGSGRRGRGMMRGMRQGQGRGQGRMLQQGQLARRQFRQRKMQESD